MRRLAARALIASRRGAAVAAVALVCAAAPAPEGARGQGGGYGYDYYSPYRSRPEPRQPRDLFGPPFGSDRTHTPYMRERSPYGVAPYTYSYDNEYGFPLWSEATYRTLCVRLCDGYYWPISFSTVRGRFETDSHQCETSCGSPARLYVHRNPGADVEQMVDLAGEPYSALPAAFRYRKEYVADCRCKPEPWSRAAKAEYEERAMAAANAQIEGAQIGEAPIEGAPIEEAPVEEAAIEPAPPPVEMAEQWRPRPAAPATRYWSAPPRPRYDTRGRGEWRRSFFFFQW